jgi:hypothetical protein
MALNAVDAPLRYRMWNTRDVTRGETLDKILNDVVAVAKSAEGGKLFALIINAHGFTSKKSGKGGFGINLGKDGIHRKDTGKFTLLRGYVERIIINSCGAAQVAIPNATGEGDGNLLCSEIASNAQAYVIAATVTQLGDAWWLPPYFIDGFEGLVKRYNPDGKKGWEHDFGRNILSPSLPKLNF